MEFNIRLPLLKPYSFTLAMSLILIFGSLNSFSRTLSDDYITTIVSRIQKTGIYVSTTTIGTKAKKSVQFENFKELETAAAVEQLIPLLKHTNPAVRVYAFRALGSKDPAQQKQIYEKLLKEDNQKVRALSGCIFETAAVNVLCMRILKSNPGASR